MRYVSLLMGLLILFCMSSCREKKPQSTEDLTVEPVVEQQAEKNTRNARWVELLNKLPDSLFTAYMEEAVAVNRSGEVFNGHMVIAKKHKMQRLQVDSLSSLGVLPTQRDSTINYEIAQFWTSDGQLFKSLVIWNSSGGSPLRELEFIAKADESQSFPAVIETRREDWMKLCNAHKAEELVKELYTENAIYYNHKPVVIGHLDIAREYAYMNQENYSLKLTPLIRGPVDENLAFEIGQCSGSYGGKYVLIWQKGPEGEWRILMDSNL
ncbi:YybH family protein [Poritiphilus flavus]|uniref:DUF4440 domain-containing protein n=1 Tax=Poritiphilus flavus TaxID=2697053 RepID=A0A6L9EBK4_9FLAO|nr:hypothetical protein [Poritiphilus flavus]NAS12033.1 hypothetical protein [Poritiphilus flavus]